MDIEVKGPKVDGSEAILTREALALVERLHRELNARREKLLARRAERQRELDRGQEFQFLRPSQVSPLYIQGSHHDEKNGWLAATGHF